MTQEDDVINQLVVYAVRYALPRHTYAVSDMADFVREHAEKISTKNLSVLCRDIAGHLEDVKSEPDSVDKPMWVLAYHAVCWELELRGCKYNSATECWEITEEGK